MAEGTQESCVDLSKDALKLLSNDVLKALLAFWSQPARLSASSGAATAGPQILRDFSKARAPMIAPYFGDDRPVAALKAKFEPRASAPPAGSAYLPAAERAAISSGTAVL